VTIGNEAHKDRVGQGRFADSDQSRLRLFLNSVAGFWGARGAPRSWVLTGSLLLIIVLTLAASFGMNVWNRLFFDALQAQQPRAVLSLSAIYLGLLAASVLLSVTQVYVRMTLQRKLREWVNNLLMDRWLTNGRCFQLNLVSDAPKNPEYRIADDVRVATESPVDFATGAITAFLSAATFVVVLWTVGGSITLRLGAAAATIPAFLVVAAIVYAATASGLMMFIGRNFSAVSENKNQAEAEYRYALTRLRENGESIAVLRGEQAERTDVDKSFAMVLRTWRELCFQHMRTGVVSQASGYMSSILPILLCAPKFLDGAMTLGQVMQAASAFVIVQAAFNWIVDNFPRLAEWSASARRVGALQQSLDDLARAEIGCRSRIVRAECHDDALRLHNLSVHRQDGTEVLKRTRLEIRPGEKVLITGESGSGKSTLVRAVAGVWPWGEGEIRIGAGRRFLIAPQRSYVPAGTLRRAAMYPEAPDSRSRAEIAQAFEKVGLGQLTDRLDEEGPWDQTLSSGEKQRLGFARILLHRPDIIVLDEAIASLDPAGQRGLMRLLLRECKDSTIVSIAQRSDLESFHDRKISLNGPAAVAGFVRDFPREPEATRPRRTACHRAAAGAQNMTRRKIRELVTC
jgi:putative ATP-binding cassette transporter